MRGQGRGMEAHGELFMDAEKTPLHGKKVTEPLSSGLIWITFGK